MSKEELKMWRKFLIDYKKAWFSQRKTIKILSHAKEIGEYETTNKTKSK